MNPVVWSALVTALGLVAVTLLNVRQTRKGNDATNALAERVVDREDFESVVDQLRASLADVRVELAEVKKELAAEVAARKEAERRATAAERRAAEAEEKAVELERRVTQLEQENEKLRGDLTIATRLLEQKYVDEPDETPDLT